MDTTTTASKASNETMNYPSIEIINLLHNYSQSLPSESRNAFNVQINAIWTIAEYYLYDIDLRKLNGLLKLMEIYIDVEKLFDNMSFTDVVSELRKDNIGDLEKVLGLCR